MAKKSRSAISGKFVFRKHMNIGAADAVEDRRFLEESFIDNGELHILSDVDNPICIVLGRTGTGKTALLEKIESTHERVIKIQPEDLALSYVANSDVLRFFVAAGVNMDLFYRLLWRHVFAVELIRRHYQIINEEAQNNFLYNVLHRFSRDRTKQEAIQYLRQWGESFWLESEYRVQEITKKLEKELGASVAGGARPSIPGIGSIDINFSAESAKHLSEEQRGEIVRKGQEVVDRVQMRALSNIMRLIENDLLDDRQKQYYVTIDRLDENWVHDEYRYHLIRALIDTVRDFNHNIENVKIIIAIREDLLDRVFRYTRSPGYQEEKYQSMYLNLVWTPKELEELLDKRVNQIIREQYTSQPVKLRNLFPRTINKTDPLQYFFNRTLYRPRDAIMFFNECIRAAAGRTKLTQSTISQAEAFYSENRLRALADEWAADYPNLIELCLFLRQYPSQFHPSLLATDHLGEKILDLITSSTKQTGQIYVAAMKKFEDDDIRGFIPEMIKIFYKIGIIGIKPNSYSSVQWCHEGKKLLSDTTDDNAVIHVHPAFWRVLGVRPV